MNLADVCNDPLEAEPFVVQRSQGGAWDNSGWADKYQTLNYYGQITIDTPKTVDNDPSATRIHAMITINCELPLYVTRGSGTGSPATCDLVMWHSELYEVIETHDYSSRGFWQAKATRMAGN